ncbi:hypothetical protein VC83_03428 [Pseudogymnoascus destructans]|uniref:Shelterin complex subunit TPP1/Est3 domain-containing protein n=2 Tax=Pseudogymnoascus destructans TaxID=655981 RepID=L8FUY8_PSED2|nr:uncharacterized protein VC83_03428 [Pseudogymnoascus destructans]ELR03551.1 hypothetical protein GMDG_01302 [Pseudogymnoascus destructans 20631-21]OAF60633.1 hypothetical protein VC83_03428 [Pseudogymnoascus destructans]
MEPELQQWICGTVIVEAKKLLRDSTQNSLQGTTKGHDNAMRVQLSGTRAVQIIDFNGQQKAPFTNISVSDVSCQIRASLSEATRKQFEKRYDRRLPHRTVGAIFEIGRCYLIFNPEIKGVPRVTLNINSLVLKGGEGSSNLGFPVPIEEIEDVRHLITRMKNTVPPQEALARSRHKCTSPIHSLTESPWGDEMGSPNGQLATQAPLASEICDKHSKVTKKPAPSSRTLKAVNLPGNQLLGLIGKNKKPNTSSSNLVGGIPESRRSTSLSDNKRAATIEDGARESNEQKFLRLTGSGNDDIRMPVDENKGSGNGKPIVHSRQGVPGENPRVGSQSTNKRGSNVGTPLVDPLRLITSRSENELPKLMRDIGLNSRPTNKPTFNSLHENPWGKLTRIPLKHVIIPKNQVVKLSTAASWVTSVADIGSLHTSLQPDTPDSLMPPALEHVEDTRDQINTTPGPPVEARQGGTNKRNLNDGSPRRVDVSSPRNSYHGNQRTENLSDNVSGDTAFQNDPAVELDAVGPEEDDALSWAPTSRASSIGPIPENGNEPLIISAFPPPHSNTHSPRPANQVPEPSSSESSPGPRLNLDRNVHLSSILPSLSDSSYIKFDTGTGLKGGGGSLANNVHSSIPHSEDDMEQRVPYAIGDVIQSSDDIYLSRIPASTITASPTRSQESPVLQIERTPYSRSQKDQPSLPEARFLGSPLEPKKPIPSPHSSAGSIILGTFNWDTSKDDDAPGHVSMHDELQQGHDKDRRTNDVTTEPSAGKVAGRSERLSTPVLDHPPIPIEAGGERELCGENRNRGGFNQNKVTVGRSSRPKSTQDVESSVGIDADKLSEPTKPLGSESPVYSVLPSLPSITSPTSKKIAKSYITRRERKRQREESGVQFP